MDEIEKALDINDLDKAERLCNIKLKSNEYDLGALFYKAIILRKKESFGEAIAVHSSLINLLPVNPDYYYERGLTYHMSKDKVSSLMDFDKSVQLDPDNPYRYSSRAFVKDFYGDHIGALEDYDKAIELDPEDAISLNNRGVIEEKLGRLEAAKGSFDKSDNITGVDQKIETATSRIEKDNSDTEEQTKPNPGLFNSFIRTLKSILSSKEERQAFIDFLFKKK